MNLLVCGMVTLFNLSQEPWNDHDKKILNNVKMRCQTIYKDAPCLKKFIKRKPKTYRAICGGKNE